MICPAPYVNYTREDTLHLLMCFTARSTQSFSTRRQRNAFSDGQIGFLQHVRQIGAIAHDFH